MMTKKSTRSTATFANVYAMLAAALRESRPDAYAEEFPVMCAWESTVGNIAAALRADNPRFNEAEFRVACGFYAS
jgi:hypothetical protein